MKFTSIALVDHHLSAAHHKVAAAIHSHIIFEDGLGILENGVKLPIEVLVPGVPGLQLEVHCAFTTEHLVHVKVRGQLTMGSIANGKMPS